MEGMERKKKQEKKQTNKCEERERIGGLVEHKNQEKVYKNGKKEARYKKIE